MTAITVRNTIDAALWFVLAGGTFTVCLALSRRFFANDRPLFAAAFVTAALVAGAAWPFSQRLWTDAPGTPTVAQIAVVNVGDTVDAGPCRGTVSLQGAGAIDEVAPRSHGTYVRGWAATPDKSARVDAVCPLVDGRAKNVDAHYGSPRPDVAKAFGHEILTRTGFSFTLAIASGSHTISIVARTGSTISILGTQSVDVP